MPAVTACLACRQLKAKCLRNRPDDSVCVRCNRLGASCDVVPRRLGRKLGSKNRPKSERASREREGSFSSRSTSPTRSVAPVRYESAPVYDEENRSRRATSVGVNGSSSFSNMLNVLARVANDMPLHQHVTSPNGSVYPFDRTRFLEQFRQPARTLDPDPYMGMAVLEEGLSEICKPDEPLIILPGEEIIHARIDQPRLDIAPEYDLISSSLLSETEVVDLLDVYWSRCNPIIRILDPEIHTLDYMRNTSATLLSSVLQVAAQCLPVSEHSSSLVSRLDSHIEFLITEVSKYGYQSTEICQALMIYVTYLRGIKQNLTWSFVSRAITMGIELRLDVTTLPSWHFTESPYHSASQTRLRRNIQRAWMLLIDWDRATAFIRGRRAMLRDHLYGSPTWLINWCSQPDALDSDTMTCAALSLRGMCGQLQRKTQQMAASLTDFDFDAHLNNVDKELKSWRTVWFSRLSSEDQQRVLHDMRCFRFVLLMTPYEHSLYSRGITGVARDECLVAALEVCKRAIPLLGGVQPVLPVNSVTCYRLYLICYTAFCTLRIMDAAPLAGERLSVDVDLFHLSILGALGKRLCELKVHHNMTSIASVLGRRLLHATRKLAATRFWRETVSVPIAEPQMVEDTDITVTSPFSVVPPLADGTMTMLDPQELAFSFDFTYLGELFPFLGEDSTSM